MSWPDFGSQAEITQLKIRGNSSWPNFGVSSMEKVGSQYSSTFAVFQIKTKACKMCTILISNLKAFLTEFHNSFTKRSILNKCKTISLEKNCSKLFLYTRNYDFKKVSRGLNASYNAVEYISWKFSSYKLCFKLWNNFIMGIIRSKGFFINQSSLFMKKNPKKTSKIQFQPFYLEALQRGSNATTKHDSPFEIVLYDHIFLKKCNFFCRNGTLHNKEEV